VDSINAIPDTGERQAVVKSNVLSGSTECGEFLK